MSIRRATCEPKRARGLSMARMRGAALQILVVVILIGLFGAPSLSQDVNVQNRNPAGQV